MTFKSNVPGTGDVPTVQTRVLGEFRIYGINIQLDPNDPAKNGIVVDFSEGFVEGGVFISVKRRSKRFTGAPMAQVILAEVEPGNTRYNEVKKGVWQILLSEGEIPSGTIV